jgi:hypothetical protein
MAASRHLVFVLWLTLFGAIGHDAWAQSPSQPRLIGAWQIVSVETIRQATGEIIYPWMGRRPTGMIVYLPNGYMAVQLMRDPPAKFASETYEGATLEETKDAFLAYYAYYGKYSIDEEKAMVTHHVEGSLYPEEHGITYRRFFKFDGDRLTLLTAPFMEGGEERVNRLVWERMK